MCLANVCCVRVLWITLTLCFAAPAAFAQGPSQTSCTPGQTDDSVDTQVRAALSAYEAGDLVTARALFECVHALAPSARTLRGIGVTAYRAGSYAEAVALLEQSLAHPIKPLDPELAARVQKMIEVASGHIDRLSLSVDPPDASVLVDGAPPQRDLRGALLLMPGSHRLEVNAPARQAVSLLVIAEPGATREMHVALAAHSPSTTAERPSPSGGSSPPSSVLPAAESDGAKSTTHAPVPPQAPLAARARRARYTGAALLVASAVAGVTLGIAFALASKRIARIERHCRQQSDGQCELGDVRQREEDARLVRLGRAIGASLPLTVAAGVSGGISLAFGFRRSSADRETKLEVALGWRASF